MKKEAFRYRILVEWSDEDQAFIARVPALPGCMARRADCGEGRARGGSGRGVNAGCVERGRPKAPPPVDAVAHYSGQLRLRLPKSLHETVSQLATAEGVSLEHADAFADRGRLRPARGAVVGNGTQGGQGRQAEGGRVVAPLRCGHARWRCFLRRPRLGAGRRLRSGHRRLPAMEPAPAHPGDDCRFVCTAPPCHVTCAGEQRQLPGRVRQRDLHLRQRKLVRLRLQGAPLPRDVRAEQQLLRERAPTGSASAKPAAPAPFTCAASPCHTSCAAGAACVVHCPAALAGTEGLRHRRLRRRRAGHLPERRRHHLRRALPVSEEG